MKLNIKKGEDVLSLPLSCAELIADADLSDLKVLLYLAKCESAGIEFQTENAADELAISESEINSSVKFWRGASVIKNSTGTKKKKEKDISQEESNDKKDTQKSSKRRAIPEKRTVHYSTSEVCEIANVNEEFKAIIDSAQQTAGWIFNNAEIEIIAILYSHLRLTSDYILALINYYVRLREKPLRYIEQVAYSFIDDGIDTAEALEARLRELEKFEGFEGTVRKLFGIGVRSFIDKERKMLRTWLEEYGYGEDIIKAAYEITVENTGKAPLSYANSVLKNWYESGVKTLSDIEKLRSSAKNKQTKTTKAGTAAARSFNVEDAMSKALERSYKGADK